MLKRLALAALVAMAGAAAPALAGDEVRTMRVDVVHTGGLKTETYALDAVRIEPLPWPGSSARTQDDLNLGLYRYEVRSLDGKMLYSRGFSSIYGEWETTEEAGRLTRSFHESLRFPAPTSPVEVAILKRNPQQAFVPVWSLKVDPADLFVDRTAPPKQELLAIEQHGAPADKLDVLLVGDGYTAPQCQTKFVADARRMVAALFAHEPFASRRDDFNVWGLCPPSAEPGISRPSTGIQRRTAVGATYDAFGSERYILSFENRALRDVAAWAPYETLEILANGNTYGGGGIYGTFATVAVDSAWAEYIFVHEFGHHIAALADEYYTSPVAYAPATQVVEPWEPNVTALLDRERLKWRHLMASSTPLPTPWQKEKFEAYQRDYQARRKQIRAERRPESDMDALFREEQAFSTQLLRSSAHAHEVGAFQGANYDAQAYYRSQADCVMFSRDAVPFCRVCQEAIGRIIDLYAGPPHELH